MKELLKLYSLANYPKQSRIHPLPTFSTETANVYVKREDELGAISSGSKLRKYLSLIPYLASAAKPVAIVGGANSNHVLSLSLLLTEKKIPYRLFLQGKKDTKIQGNFFFTLLGYPSTEILWVDEDLTLEELKVRYEKELETQFSWVPIGGSCKQSLPGALTLTEDIQKNERESSVTFDHIFIDAGTGFTAAALLLGLGYLERKTKTHIVQMAGGDLEFFVMLEECKSYFKDLFGMPISPSEFHMHRPKKAKSFGSISREHIEFIKTMAKEEGILLDPMYNSKLFLEAKERIIQENLTGTVLVIQSGGTLSLSGFTHIFTDL